MKLTEEQESRIHDLFHETLNGYLSNVKNDGSSKDPTFQTLVEWLANVLGSCTVQMNMCAATAPVGTALTMFHLGIKVATLVPGLESLLNGKEKTPDQEFNDFMENLMKDTHEDTCKVTRTKPRTRRKKV